MGTILLAFSTKDIQDGHARYTTILFTVTEALGLMLTDMNQHLLRL